jgi:hypothetical protein
MDAPIAKALFDALEDQGCHEISFRDSYSGRGMYGKETCGISGEFGWGDIARAWANVCVQDDTFNPDDLDFTWDAMGLGTIIY